MISAEYIWLGGKGEHRSKSRILQVPQESLLTNPKSYPIWHYDGSSTGQAEVGSSDVSIIPVRVYPDPYRQGSVWVLCETLERVDEGTMKPLDTNTRAKAHGHFASYDNDLKTMFGFEQEFYIEPLPLDARDSSYVQGEAYCGVGYPTITHRSFMEEVETLAQRMGLAIAGRNFEVAPGQAEFQLLSAGIKAADDLIMLRYLLLRHSERAKVAINFEPKPYSHLNGSGCHTNISTVQTRSGEGGILGIDWIRYFIKESLAPSHDAFMEVSGRGNEERMTGTHETSEFGTFSYGEMSRGVSIRIPEPTVRESKGYFEDRRPASSMDPYLVTGFLTRQLGMAYVKATRDDPTEDNTDEVEVEEDDEKSGVEETKIDDVD